ncbi:hypothetical protein KEM63_05655 [Halopseudomonas nanhaiensis]|uniref:lipopolysaccharide biosynthesis protein n=1 Tax=Halopseudomonas nanhaiensis TaxID=2830842 RepID=UPI001CBC7B99|nr:hypothetical protein [Halopseudomonas nanhaiensis]UAW99451.1 hypothetical protein KEM63_05655 [Halopseudomonas nanhaiensis]
MTITKDTLDSPQTQSRIEEREKRIKHSAVAALFAKAIQVIAALITVPLTLPYLGEELFGVWMAITGIFAFLAFADLGINIGLQQSLTANVGRLQATRKSISNAFFLLTTIVITIFSAYQLLPAEPFLAQLAVNKELVPELKKTMDTMLYIFLLGLYATFFQRIFEAYQDGKILNILFITGRLLSLASVVLAVQFDLGLAIMIAMYTGLPMICLLAGGALLLVRFKHLRPRLKENSLSTWSQLIRTGSQAFLAQVGASLMLSGPIISLAAVYGAAAIVPFALVQRLAGLVGMLLSAVLGPLWPAYGDAVRRGDSTWIAKTFRRSVNICLAVSIPAFIGLVCFGQDIISVWTTKQAQVQVEKSLLYVCGLWMVLTAFVRAFSMLLNGVGKLKGQAIYGVFLPFAAISIAYSAGAEITLPINLLIVVLIGEAGRVACMAIETRRHLTGART